MAKIPERPKNVPQAADWISYKKMWTHGSLENQQKRGLWTWWRSNGKLHSEEHYEKGVLQGIQKRYHNNDENSLCKETNYEAGQIHGWVSHYRTQNSIENFPRVYSTKVAKAKVYHYKGKPIKWFFYLKDGKVVDTYARKFPKGVEAEAWWNVGSYVWEKGDFSGSTKIGSWKSWREDGSQISQDNYNNKGELHGSFKRFHNNGEMSKASRYENGQLHGNCSFFRSGNYTRENHLAQLDKRIWTKTLVYNRGQLTKTKYFRRNGEECNSKGFPLVTNSNVNDIFQGEVSNFLDRNFEEYLGGFKGGSLKELNDAESQKYRYQFRYLWGMDMPAQLAKAFDIFQRADNPSFFNGFEACPPRTDQLHDWIEEENNIVEQAILAMQENYPFDYFTDWITGSQCLDPLLMNPENSYNSFSYHYSLYGVDKGAVYIHRHQSVSHWGTNFDHKFASDLSAFLYFQTLFSAYGEYGILTDAKFNQAYQKLIDKIKLPYSFLGNFRVGNTRIYEHVFKLNPKPQPTVDYFTRNKWIMELLRGETDMYSIRHQIFAGKLSRQKISAEQHVQNLRDLPHNVPQALFYLFGTYFVKDCESFLAAYIPVCKESPSRIISDAAGLIEEFVEGRRGLGLIADMHHYKQQFNG